jgi:glutaredoxin 3
MAKIEIYTKPFCPYCERAKALFDKKGVSYEEIKESDDPTKRKEMNERSNRNTFPQIFINQVHIGGCDDLMVLEQKGSLDPLLSDS